MAQYSVCQISGIMASSGGAQLGGMYLKTVILMQSCLHSLFLLLLTLKLLEIVLTGVK